MPRRIVFPSRAVLLTVSVLAALALVSASARAQSDVRSPLPAPVKVKLGMTNVPALSPLWLLPDFAAKYNVQIEMVMFQRFADARTALASGDLDITAFGPQDISLALGQGAKSMVGIAGIGSGNDCLIVRKGDDIKDWKALKGKAIGVGAGSISWLKFAASTQENGVEYSSLKVVNIMGGGGNYLKALQAKEIDMAVVWQPFCAQGIVDGIAQYPTIDHNKSKTVGGLISVLAVNRTFMEKNRDATQRLVVAYLDVLKVGPGRPREVVEDLRREGRAAGAGGRRVDPHHAARRHAAAGVDQADLEVPLGQRRHRPRRVGRGRAVLHVRLPEQGDRQVAGGSRPEPVGPWPTLSRRPAAAPRLSGASCGPCCCRWRS